MSKTVKLFWQNNDTRFPAIVILFMNISFASGLPRNSFLASSSMMVNPWLVGAKTVKGPPINESNLWPGDNPIK